MEIKLTKNFASNTKVDEFDVKQMKKALNRLGYYQPLEKVGITGMADAKVFAALKAFQKDQGLEATGSARPNDKTVQVLNEEAKKTKEGQYFWRTMEDDKVRSSHAEFNRTIRNWNDSPDPGEEFNCRCWADPIDKEAQGLSQKIISDMRQAHYQWTDVDFIKHWAKGEGRTVTLSEIGWLSDIVGHARQIMFYNVQKQIADKAREVQSGAFSDTWERSYDFQEIVFSIGDAVIKGKFQGTVVRDKEILHIEAIVNYFFSDQFSDFTSIREKVIGTSDPDALLDNWHGDAVLFLTEAGQTPYDIIGEWTTKVSGSISISISQQTDE